MYFLNMVLIYTRQIIIIITFLYANFMYWLDYFIEGHVQGHQLYLNCYVLPS